ncbi:uncharacterized protein LOC129727662 [Wyeomyia smithii]|uniref:uncharacterized protein LOC129727662 n=1 Tax=Wyeomyia smithii TaxID=174621 RepID=UPI002467CA37|nr:uncharacterized protein LOC129727662 [Wyeomyia smithii]
MPCMSMFCSRLSTRLGSIIVGTFTIFQILSPLLVLLTTGGANKLRETALQIRKLTNGNDHQGLFLWLLDFTEHNSSEVFQVITIYLGLHIAGTLIMIMGALKLQRYLLMPFVLLDFVKLCILTTAHIVSMMVIKKHLNLGELITLTISGGFFLLLLFYLWACVVALYQIIVIVKTDKYQAIYGKDPTTSDTDTGGGINNSTYGNNISMVEPISKDNFLRH